MNFDDIPEPLIEKNKASFLTKAFLASFATFAIVNCTMLPHYRLITEDTHKDCMEVAEALEKEGVSKGWDRTKRTFSQWRENGLFSGNSVSEDLQQRAETCENLGPIMLASIWYAERVIIPIEENWVITIGKKHPSTWETGAEVAGTVAEHAKEGAGNTYERTKDWFGQTWDNITGGDEPEETTARQTQQIQEETEPAPTLVAPPVRYNENGDIIEPDKPSITDRAKDALDNIDWTPWN